MMHFATSSARGSCWSRIWQPRTQYRYPTSVLAISVHFLMAEWWEAHLLKKATATTQHNWLGPIHQTPL